uniref:tetratricopeptide repeat protein n=1 Tax=Herbidospora sakaeratensis TaxID=564415 RepID=UPI0014716841|nr:tetratricopeptide repeat protein [Herbidospora sakaeratensis]
MKVFWIPAEEPEGMRAALYALAFLAGAGESEFSHAHPADILWRRLNALDFFWLLIIDNVDDPAVLGGSRRRITEGTEWIRPPETSNGAIIISSRNGRPERWAPWIKMRHIAPLDPEAGALILLDLAPSAGSHTHARDLARLLDGLPLALELAGRYLAAVSSSPFPIRGSATTFAEYMETYSERIERLGMDESRSHEPEEDRRVLSLTWEISLDLLNEQGHDLARPLLRLFSCCAPSPFPYQAILRPEVLSASPLFPDPTPERLAGALRALAGLSLITLDFVPRADDLWAAKINMHQLVRTMTRINAKRSGSLANYLTVLIQLLETASQDLEADNAGDWPKWAAIAPHCTAVLELVVADGIDPASDDLRLAMQTAQRVAWYRYMSGQYNQSVIDHEQAWNLAVRSWGRGSIEALETAGNLGRAMRENGDASGAEEFFRSTLAIAHESVGDEHPVSLTIRLSLARTVRETGRFSEAEAELRALLSIARRVLGGRHADTLMIVLNLAVCLRAQGRFEEGIRYYEEALAGWREDHSEDDLNTLDIRFEIAQSKHSIGLVDEAVGELRGIVEIAARVYGDEHPNTLTIRHGLAMSLKTLGETQAAIEELRQVLEGQRAQLGADHPLYLSTRRALEELTQ